MRLVLFDLDNTLLAGDSDRAWGEYLARIGVVDESHIERQRAYHRQYEEGTLNIHEFLAFQLAPLAQFSRQELETWRENFLHEVIAPMVTERARRLVEGWRQKEAFLIVITATNAFVTEPIAKKFFGIEHVIATIPEEKEGRFTGRIFGTPSFQEGKIHRLRHFLKEKGLIWEEFWERWFYSDSHNDLPLLSLVDFPVVVDPDPILTQHAKDNIWPLLLLNR